MGQKGGHRHERKNSLNVSRVAGKKRQKSHEENSEEKKKGTGGLGERKAGGFRHRKKVVPPLGGKRTSAKATIAMSREGKKGQRTQGKRGS